MRSVILLVLACGCARPTADPGPRITADPAPVDAAEPAPVATTTTSAPAPAPAPAPASVWCSSDAECAFDDPCRATACVGAGDAAFAGCDKSFPPPGSCICADHRCTLMRKVAATGAAISCVTNGDCALVASTGTCAAGTGASRGPIWERGAYCACDGGACKPVFVEEVPCKASSDCSWLEDPRRPAPSSKVPRPYPPVTPCKTGSFDSVCSAGHCVLRAWKC